MNDMMIADGGMDLQANTGMAQVLEGAQGAQIKASIVVAKQFPRNEARAMQNMVASCQRRRFADEALYAYPKGSQKLLDDNGKPMLDEKGKERWIPKIVTGPSIRMAEEMARCWGNINYGQMNISANDKAGFSEVMAFAWDLESNMFQSRVFRVRHEIKAGNSIKKLTDPRDIYELEANMGARRMRACIMSLIPKDIQDELVATCEKTMEGDNTTPLPDRISRMVTAFQASYGVTAKMLEDRLGHPVDEITGGTLVQLQGVFRSLRDGFAKPADFFPAMAPERQQSAESQSLTAKFVERGNQPAAVALTVETKVGDVSQTVTGQGETVQQATEALQAAQVAAGAEVVDPETGVLSPAPQAEPMQASFDDPDFAAEVRAREMAEASA